MLDDRTARADLAVREAALDGARQRLAETAVTVTDLRDQLDRGDRLSKAAPGLAISDDSLTRRRFAVRAADAKADTARSDIRSNQAQVEAGMAAVALLTVRSPIDATVLQVNIRPGEFASATALATPLIILGQVEPLHVRVDIDEADVPRFNPNARAWGAQRGTGGRGAPLRLVRVDPILVPKTSLTGAGSERVDTRVLRVVYAFDPSALSNPYPGGQMDVSISIDPPGGSAASPTRF